MIEKFVNYTLGLIFGCVSGAVAASLLTPKSGEEVRGELRNSFEEIKLEYELGRQKKREDLEADLRQRCGE